MMLLRVHVMLRALIAVFAWNCGWRITKPQLMPAETTGAGRCSRAKSMTRARSPRQTVGRAMMSAYILLMNWTDQGVRHVKDSPGRLDAAKKALKDEGGEFKHVFLTMGAYDLIAVYEAPDDAVAARFTMQLGMMGNVRTQTLKAFPEAAYREIINTLK
jgi:uncharacterized protein with GYD domain